MVCLAKLLKSNCKHILGLEELGASRIEGEDVVHVVTSGKSNDVTSCVGIKVITSCWSHSHDLFKVGAELRKARNIEGYSLLKK